MPKSKPDDAGNIRSLSAPSVQVRHTKTSFLRKVFSVNNADLAFLVNPPMGETNPTVVGQNKSVAKTMEKNVNTWYRERTYHTERLSRMEDEVYEKLCILERKKQNILRSTDASLERSATGIGGQFTHGEDMSELVETENGVVNGEAENETGTGLSQVERPPIGDANSQQPSKTAVKFSAQPEEANNERDAFAKDNSRAKSGEDAKNTVTKKTSKFETVLETSVKVNHDGDSKSVRVNYLAPRPTTQGALVTARENDETSVPRPLTQIGRLPSTTTESKPVFHRENSAANGKSSRQSRSMLNIHQPGHSASPRPPPLIGDKFIYWKKEKNGKIMQSDLPYKRREFEVPAERDDAGRKKKLLYKEQTSVRASLDKYASLSHNIDKLAEWNPLDDILEQERLEKEEALRKLKFNPKEGWQKLGALASWVQAFGGIDKDLADLDPNSPEALKRCKYLRVKADDLDMNLMPDDEKGALKSGWTKSNGAVPT